MVLSEKSEYGSDVYALGCNFCSESFILKTIILEMTLQNAMHLVWSYTVAKK